MLKGLEDGIFSLRYIPETIPLINGQQWRQVRALSSGGSEHSSWYKIWDVLFPDCPRPSSPFLIYEEHDSSEHRSETLSVCAAPRATPTDSGYASAPALFDIHISAQDKRHTPRPEDDLQTVYSAVTTVVPTTLRESILHVCETIHDQIKPRLNSPDFKTDSTLIPWIIKIFAIELGLEDPCSGSANWGIMHFVHKHHEQISSQLRRVLQDIDSDNDSNPGRHEWSGMSLVDKMSLWGKKAEEEQQTNFKEGELFIGVEEEDDDDDDLDTDDASPLPSAFAKEILQSRAYTGLIERIMRELSLHRADTECFPDSQSIKATILSQLPTGTISKNRPPQTYTATFHLPWAVSDAALDATEKRPPCLISPGEDLAKRIVLVLSASDRVQATTVRQYLEQTWPLDAPQLLHLLCERLWETMDGKLEGSKTTCTSIHRAGTVVALPLSGVVIQASGPPHFIAELGEILGWLVAAVQSETLSGVQSTPLIHSVTEAALLDNGKISHHGWKLSVQQEQLSASPATCVIEKIQKFSFAQGFPIAAVKGYPTKHRPDDYPGVEISPKLFASVVCLVDLNAGLYDRGNDPRSFPPALKLLKKKGKIMFWHAPISVPACRCPRDLSIALDDGQWPRRTVQDIQEYRHIISTCQSAIEIRASSTVRADTPSTETELSLDDNPAVPLNTLIYPRYRLPPPIIVSETVESSLDSDAFSMSEFSTDALPQDVPLGGQLSSLVDSITSALLSSTKAEFVARGPSEQTPRSGIPTSGSLSTPNHLSVNGGRSQQPYLKRPIGDDEEDDEVDDRPRKRQNLGDPEEASSRKFLACPFWKLDPMEHKACFRMRMDKISRVKQHLTRKHLPAFYCERCMLVLPDEQAHLAHIQIMNCSFQSERFIGITHRQQRELSRKSNSNLSVTDQWFAIWGIVFPNTPRPLSAYMDPDLSEDLCRFREYAELHGPQLIEEEIRSSQIEGINLELEGPGDSALLQHVISRGLNRIFENWLGARPRNNSHATILSHTSGQDTSENNYNFQQRRSIDSGVAMQGSQRSQNHDRERPRGYQPAVTSWPASFQNYSLAAAGTGLGDDSGRLEYDIAPAAIPISITGDAPSPRANAISGDDWGDLLGDAEWEGCWNDVFPGGSGLT
ncbi:hypothetical protein QBC38DRAFT_377349 [Podospora fimiseda]|uniref:C2H2-type domain-containing protein n=1 Tax=Podospora fimiseda TaxID=252190 RepID=A0AAN6YM76_9PEZI|nr:hypothetical protein QBC38DRAFT_377349 [Podospora fimiseda]